jgi:hypothetical protein
MIGPGRCIILAACLLAVCVSVADTLAFVSGTETNRQLVERCADLREKLLDSGIRSTEARVLIREGQMECDRLQAGDVRRRDVAGPCLVAGAGVVTANALAARRGGRVHTTQYSEGEACCSTGTACLTWVEGTAKITAVCGVIAGIVAVAGIVYLIYYLIKNASVGDDEPYRPGDRLNSLIARYSVLLRLQQQSSP